MQLLINHRYSRFDGSERRSVTSRLGVQENLAGILMINAAENLKQRALPCSVFTAQSMHAALFDAETNVFEGANARKRLCQILEAKVAHRLTASLLPSFSLRSFRVL